LAIEDEEVEDDVDDEAVPVGAGACAGRGERRMGLCAPRGDRRPPRGGEDLDDLGWSIARACGRGSSLNERSPMPRGVMACLLLRCGCTSLFVGLSGGEASGTRAD